MPREKQKRGRRAEAKAIESQSKRKREHEEADSEEFKRPRTSIENQDNGEIGEDYIPLEGSNEAQAADTPFFGLLDPEEQEYFSKASQTLELNQFQDDDDKNLFIESIYEEATGKELKLACSQSCSRLMEKLIAMSSVNQIKTIFERFTGHFLHLVQHRFASHCCECLFIRAAPIAASEMGRSKGRNKEAKRTNKDSEREEQNDSESQSSITDLLLGVIPELQGNWGYLLTESFASHTLRVLLLILAGEPLAGESNAKLLASRKKENLDMFTADSQLELSVSKKREVHPAFTDALKKMIIDLSDGLNTTYIQALATHPVGSPVLQVVLFIELSHMGKETIKDTNSVFRRIVPDETLDRPEGTSFLTSLFYDPVGSRLLETIIRYAPGKFFKEFYRSIIRDRVGSLSRNETASYVIIRVLERVSKDDLQTAMDSIVPEIPSLVERSRLNVIKALIERSVIRGADTIPLADALKSAYGSDSALRLGKILNLNADSQTEKVDDNTTKSKNSPSPQQIHGSLVAQAMLQAPGPLAEMMRSSFLDVQPDTILDIAKNPAASRALQESLTYSKTNVHFRRQFVPKFYGHMCDLALDACGSHVADALWQATSDLIFMKQRLAEELTNNEPALRDSFFGRAVWRNWSMDMYKRKRGEWVSKAKSVESHGEETLAVNESTSKPKSKLDLARARFAANAEHQNNKYRSRVNLIPAK